MNFTSPLACLVIFFGTISFAVWGNTIELTSDQMPVDAFNPAKLLATANKLISLGKKDAEDSLLKFADKPYDSGYSGLTKRDFNVAWLCLMVYDPKPGSGLPIPMFGLPGFPNTGGYNDHGLMNLTTWPRFPLALSKGVPFLLVSGYALAGLAEPGIDYLKRCQAHGEFHTNLYPIPTYDEAKIALHELISSSQWKALNWAQDQGAVDPDFLNHEVEVLSKQVERIK
ncbi:MAG: hypothetical protein LV480_05125 [Methylacidiphilales bacterium]|nr:hypothetical protein [Candidatus Methylacidiphilales bacterium]